MVPPREHILDKAELIVLDEIQRSYFTAEFNNFELKEPCSCAFQCLRPFIQGIIRASSRWSKSDLPFEHKPDHSTSKGSFSPIAAKTVHSNCITHTGRVNNI